MLFVDSPVGTGFSYVDNEDVCMLILIAGAGSQCAVRGQSSEERALAMWITRMCVC